MQERNYYEILEIDNSAESEAIHLAYKRLSKEYQHNESTLFDYILKMQELNKAYITLASDDERTEYNEGLESESDTKAANVEVPFEVDEKSANKNKVKLESCSLRLDDENDIKAIGEVSSTNREQLDKYLKIHFSIYDSNERLIGVDTTFGDKSGHQMIFDNYLFNKFKPAVPTKVKICFVE